jgi:hypothetical protein
MQWLVNAWSSVSILDGGPGSNVEIWMNGIPCIVDIASSPL